MQFEQLDIASRWHLLASEEGTSKLAAFLLRQTGLHLVGAKETPEERRAILAPEPVSRSLTSTATVRPAVKGETVLQAAIVMAERAKLTLVGLNGAEATFNPSLPADVKIRGLIAGVLRTSKAIEDHEVDVVVERSAEGDGHIETVTVRVSREVAKTKEDSEKLWRNVVHRIDPVNAAGWSVDIDLQRGVATLTWGLNPELPTMVPARELLPSSAHNDEPWYRLNIGKDLNGQPVGPNFKVGPHALIVGDTGSGKTVATRMLVTQALLHGWEVIFLDPMKQMLGLKSFIPWLTDHVKAAGDMNATAAALAAVYAEGQRRLTLIGEMTDDGDSWTDLPEGTLKPIMVIIDEYAGVAAIPPKPAGAKPGGETMLNWEAQAEPKGRIRDLVGRIARELRASGISLVLVLQRPDAKLIEGDVRQQLGSSIQLVAPADDPDATQLGMVFSPASAQRAMEIAAQLGGDGRPGFAMARIEGQPVTGFRVAFIDKTETAQVLEAAGVPKAQSAVPVPASKPRPVERLRAQAEPAPSTSVWEADEGFESVSEVDVAEKLWGARAEPEPALGDVAWY